MNIKDFTFDMFKACALKCPLQLPKHNGPVDLRTGDWWVMPAKNEAVWKYTRLCKNDLREKELRRAAYDGYLGQTTIGGRVFLHHPAASVIVRRDFYEWCERNWHKVLTADGSERKSTKPLHSAAVEPLPVNRHALHAKLRAKELAEPTELIPEESWNTEYEIQRNLNRYHAEIERDRLAGRSYIVTRLQGVLLAAMAQHRRRNYAEAVDNFISVAACAIKAAEFEARMHSKAKEGGGK